MKIAGRKFFYCFILLLTISVLAVNPSFLFADQAKNILVLHSYHQGFTWTDNVMEGIRSVLDEESSDIELTVEYMDVKRNDPEKLFPILEQLYREKFNKPFDAVIVSDDSGLEFLLSQRKTLLPEIPIIFCGINNYNERLRQNHSGITGVLEDIDLAGTVDLVLQLQPSTKRIAVISDSTKTGREYLKRLQRIEPHFKGVVQFTHLNNFTFEEMATVLKNMPEDTVVLLLSIIFDRTGKVISQKQGVELITESFGLPIYTVWDFFVRYGVLGGVVVSGRMQGENAARMALEIIGGKSADQIPILRESPNVPMFDYAQLKNYGLSGLKLPGDTIILNEPESFYYQNTNAIWLALIIAIILVSLVFILWMNIIKRKQAQRNESNLLRQLKTVFHHLPVGIAYLDEEYTFIGANRFFSSYCGYNESQLIGRKCYDMIGEYADDDQKEGLLKICSFCKKNECFKDKKPTVLHRSLGDSFFKVTIIPELNRAGEVYRIMEVFEDITDRRLAEKAVRESERNFRELVESSLAGILIIQEGRIIYKNPEQESLFGPITDSFSLMDYEGIYKDDFEKVHHMFQQISKGESQVFDMDFRFYPQGSIGSKPDMKWVYCRARLIEFQGREATIVSMMDMTRSKELEHLLKMEDKMTSLGHVAAGIAHEIRNPLSGINIYLSALKKIYHRGENTEKVAGIIGQLQSASGKIESVIRRVMDFSKPSEPRFKHININKPVETAMDLSAVTLRKTGIVLEKKLAENLPSCYLDIHLMEQVIMNLVNNASDSMRSIEGEKIIEISSFQRDDHVAVNIADSGPGVPENLRDKIFEPFYTTKYDGTGIGLSLCLRIISDHSGTLDVYKSHYDGAEFRIEIPIERRKKPRD